MRPPPGLLGRFEAVVVSAQQDGTLLPPARAPPDGLRHPGCVDIRRKTFVAEATRRLGFLVEEHGFAGPEITQDCDYPLLLRVIYHRGDLDVIGTLLLSYGGEEYVTADLAHQSPARRTELPAGSAHTGFQMRRALDRHAQALRELFAGNSPISG
jgi:hypothetical protein